MRNGRQAHIVPSAQGFNRVVHGQDSPMPHHPISQKDVLSFSDWSINTVNKNAALLSI